MSFNIKSQILSPFMFCGNLIIIFAVCRAQHNQYDQNKQYYFYCLMYCEVVFSRSIRNCGVLLVIMAPALIILLKRIIQTNQTGAISKRTKHKGQDHHHIVLNSKSIKFGNNNFLPQILKAVFDKLFI